MTAAGAGKSSKERLKVAVLETMIDVAKEYYQDNIKKLWHQTTMRLQEQYLQVGIGHLCNLFGKTRHAWYDRLWLNQERYGEEQIVVEMLREIKRDMSGGRKHSA